jgi:DNA anti-recombination protein RmuC
MGKLGKKMGKMGEKLGKLGKKLGKMRKYYSDHHSTGQPSSGAEGARREQ